MGCLTGHWLIFDTQTRELLGQYKDGVEPIQVVQYSPDGTMLAVGSRDNNIYVYQIGEETNKCSRIGKCMVSSVLFFFLFGAARNVFGIHLGNFRAIPVS